MDVQKTRALSDLELLEIEMDVLWGSKAGPELVLGCARNGVRARIGDQIPPDIARSVAAHIEEGASLIEDSGAPPAQLERWRLALEDALGAAVRLTPGSGPSYLIEPAVSFRTTAELIRSDSGNPMQLRAANPGNEQRRVGKCKHHADCVAAELQASEHEHARRAAHHRRDVATRSCANQRQQNRTDEFDRRHGGQRHTIDGQIEARVHRREHRA
jgi:hypothetical protein